jgi:hypothetical protein
MRSVEELHGQLEQLKNLRAGPDDLAFRNTCLLELDLEIKIAILCELENIRGALKGER